MDILVYARDISRNGNSDRACRRRGRHTARFLYVVFWFAGDTLVDYVLLTGHDLRQDRKLAGRLASMKVVFSETYEDAAYTQDEVDSLHSEIQDDIRGTIPEEC